MSYERGKRPENGKNIHTYVVVSSIKCMELAGSDLENIKILTSH